jgi:hypothetical protein
MSATGTRVTREAPAVFFLEGIGVACSFVFGAIWRRKSSKQEFEAASALVPGFGEPFRRTCRMP